MDSKRKKGNYRLLILLSILLGIFFISTTAYARDGTLGYGESFSVKIIPVMHKDRIVRDYKVTVAVLNFGRFARKFSDVLMY